MARYILFTLRAEAMPLIAATQKTGDCIAEHLERFLLLPRYSFGSTDPDSPLHTNPDPLPIQINRNASGFILGVYYDGTTVGVSTLPAQIPAQSYVYTVLTDTHEIARLAQTPGPEISDAAEAFGRDALDAEFYRCVAHLPFMPVFLNRTENAYALCILKRTPFELEDKDKLEWQGGFPFSLSPHCRVPRCMSYS